jgi:hypothetical protein
MTVRSPHVVRHQIDVGKYTAPFIILPVLHCTRRSSRLANALCGAGLAPGTPVAAMLEDRISSLEAFVLETLRTARATLTPVLTG